MYNFIESKHNFHQRKWEEVRTGTHFFGKYLEHEKILASISERPSLLHTLGHPPRRHFFTICKFMNLHSKFMNLLCKFMNLQIVKKCLRGGWPSVCSKLGLSEIDANIFSCSKYFPKKCVPVRTSSHFRWWKLCFDSIKLYINWTYKW